MTLVYDERQSLQGKPGLHALIAGVSLYKHLPNGGGVTGTRGFGLQQLSSPAITAYKIYRWLLDNKDRMPLPLVTVRLLISPSAAELAKEPAMAAAGADPCSYDNFAAAAHGWRDDAGGDERKMTLFYFAGHGVQRKKSDAVMLMDDFNKPFTGPLSKAVDMENIFNGMAPPADTSKKIAQCQLYFVDACRMVPEEFNNLEWLNVPDVWGVDKSGRDDRVAPIFYAAVPGTEAKALKARTTFFGEALLQCLDGAAGEAMEQNAQGDARWGVSVYSLAKALPAQIEALNKKYKVAQDWAPGGLVKDEIICYMKEPPKVPVALEIDPQDALPYVTIEVKDYAAGAVWDLKPPLQPYPYEDSLPAGFYTFTAKVTGAGAQNYKDYVRLLKISPPRGEWKAKVSS